MTTRWLSVVARIGVTTLFLGWGSGGASAQGGTPAYPKMAPLPQYLSPSAEDEVALARSAAPLAVARDAEILVLSPKGYETAVKGTNGFVCLVDRPWDNNFDSPDFWNPKIRAPECFNRPAARSFLPAYLRRTEWVLAGVSRAEMLARTKSAVAAHEIRMNGAPIFRAHRYSAIRPARNP